MIKHTHEEDYTQFENILNDALRSVALEIRSVALLDLASFIHANKLENVRDIIDSATELFFRSGTVVFSNSGEVKLDWFGVPVVILDLELHQSGIDIYFRLNIETFKTQIQILHATLNLQPLRVEAHLHIFEEALQNAKVARDNRCWRSLHDPKEVQG